MKLALFAYSRTGCDTAQRVRACFPDAEIRTYTMAKFQRPGFEAIKKGICGECFAWADTMIFVGACGIAVRQIAPYVHDKTTDPAVLCLDERAQFVISLLSGHIGGANAMTRQLAQHLGAVPVITTATDVNRRFSVDAWAAEHALIIDSMANAKAVSAAILERDIPIATPLPVVTDYPAGTCPGSAGDIGIYIGWKQETPFQKTLRLIPGILHLGIGCRRGTDESAIAEAVRQVLEENSIDPRAISCAASVDLKADEPGLHAYCTAQGLPIRFYTAAELMALPGEFTVSEFVRKTAGVDCVCERAACMGAEHLIVKKTARQGVTVAIAAERYEVSFG